MPEGAEVAAVVVVAAADVVVAFASSTTTAATNLSSIILGFALLYACTPWLWNSCPHFGIPGIPEEFPFPEFLREFLCHTSAYGTGEMCSIYMCCGMLQ
jgi:hypothetical protein